MRVISASKSLLLAAALISVSGCALLKKDDLEAESPAMLADVVAVETIIEALLAEQQAAWNAGDIDGFMAGY